MAEKRKHVVFDEEPSAGVSAGVGMHPDRAAKLQKTETPSTATVSSGKAKEKTAAKQRYLKKSRDKRKKREKAKKAAAPKRPQDNEDLPSAATSAAAAKMSTDDAVDEEDEEEDEEAARERRKAEKRAKREARRKEPKQPKATVEPTSAEVEPTLAEDEKEAPEAPSRSPSPPSPTPERLNTPDIDMDAIPAFPLPEGPAKVDPAVLTAQALPPALRQAIVVREDVQTSLDDFTYARRDWKGKGKDETMAKIGDEMKAKLRKMGVEELFPVQAALLPELLPMRHVTAPEEILHDFLVSAPTGSGKTLAYAIPLIEVLSKRIVIRPRALIVLPTRDLVMQVRDTLETLAKGTGLRIGTAAGQHSFAHEQNAIVGNPSASDLLGGASAIDILVATPGRLMEHLQGTPNFTLQHLRFLVIDEADRLLTQAFQDWLGQVLRYLKPPTVDQSVSPSKLALQPDSVAPSWLRSKIRFPEPWEGWTPTQSPCQKLLFSATLTTDPSKVAALELRNPRYYLIKSSSSEQIDGTHQFTFPAGLKEKMVVLPPALKPLNLLHLLHGAAFNINSALCFTKSVDAAERLVNLVNFFEAAYLGSAKRFTARTYSGELRNSERQRLLKEFQEGKFNLLVCSDLIARGIDLPSVEHVISYDIPIDARKYVHRVGRTARAGREGVAWSLVEKQEARHFKSMLTSIDHLKQVKKVKIQEADLGELKDSYQIALGRMKELYAKHAS